MLSQVQNVVFDGALWTPDAAMKWLSESGFHTTGFQTRVKPAFATGSTDHGKLWRGEVPILKLDEEQQIAFGWLYVTRRADGSPVVDHSLEVISIKTLEVATYDYVLDSRKGGVMHERGDDGDVRVIGQICECVCVTAEKKVLWGSPGPPVLMNEGTWIGLKVMDDGVWLEFKTGKLKMFSLGGRARKVEL